MPPSPSAARMLAEKGLSADQVAGTGKRGQVLKGDVHRRDRPRRARRSRSRRRLRSSQGRARAPSPAEDEAREERVKMTRLRQTIARRLKDAQATAAMLTTFNEVDMKRGDGRCASKYKELFEKKHGVKLGFMGFFTKAVMPRAQGDPGRQRRDRRHRHHLQELLPYRRGRRHRQGPRRAGGARRRPDVNRRDREGDRPAGCCRARRQARHRRHAGRHLHHLQWRRLRLADVDADPQCAAVGHSGHAQDPGAADGGRRPDRHPPDDVSGA